MSLSQRESYLKAMQIDTWVPRVTLPNARPLTNTQQTDSYQNTVEKCIDENINTPIPDISPKTSLKETAPTVPSVIEEVITQEDVPQFSLQLLQTGSCLLLVEQPNATLFKVDDPHYQLLSNILHAAKLPNRPHPLGELIQWPLFKQTSIAQGKKEAQEFLQSFIMTYQEQFTDTRCLWLIGSSSICYATTFDETHYFEAPFIEPYGQTLLSPSLDKLMAEPNLKASLWRTLQKLIPTWHN